MILDQVNSHDGITLRFGVTEAKPDKPWLALVFPFGLKLELAQPFFDFFECHYNVVAWETRSILEESDRPVREREFAIENHLLDMKTVMELQPTSKFVVVGYCSGAGLALAIANRYPHLVEHMILVHGEYAMLNKPDCTTQFAAEIDSLLSLAGTDDEHLDLVFDKIKEDRFEGQDSDRPDGIDMPFTNKAFLRRHAANYLAYKQTDFAHLARYVTHRTFLISGERDAQANATSTRTIAEQLPNARIFIDPEADHYGILRENSETLIRIWNYLYEQYAQVA